MQNNSFITECRLTARNVIREFATQSPRPCATGALAYRPKSGILKAHNVPIAVWVDDDTVAITLRRMNGNTIRDRINMLLKMLGCKTKIMWGGRKLSDGRPFLNTQSWCVRNGELIPTAEATA